MSTSQKQLEANRRNAQKSSGLKINEGKKFVSKNAIKHGLYSNDIIIKSAAFSEDANEYEDSEAEVDANHAQQSENALYPLYSTTVSI